MSGMALLDIIKLPDPLLRKPSKPVAMVTADTRKLMDDMTETWHAAPVNEPGRAPATAPN